MGPSIARSCKWAEDMNVDESLLDAVVGASVAPPDNPPDNIWATHRSVGPGRVPQRTVANAECGQSRGSPGGHRHARRRHDTNAAICGALLGAVESWQAIPTQWTECLRECRPAGGGGGDTRCPSSPAGTLLAGRCTRVGGASAAGRGRCGKPSINRRDRLGGLHGHREEEFATLGVNLRRATLSWALAIRTQA